MDKVLAILSRITADCLLTEFKFICEYDNKYSYTKVNPPIGRIYIQVQYRTMCTKTNKLETWKGRKFYLSDHMTDDEIVKTAYTAFKMAVEHEVMEGFRVDNIVLFNPHVNFEELLKVSHNEVTREN
jgi:hypothetical protein